jgi:hypothetical protein
MNVIKFVIHWYLTAQYASAFLHTRRKVIPPKTSLSILHATKTPIIVVGSIYEGLGAAMATCAQDVLLNSKVFERNSPVPPAQPIVFCNNIPDDGQNSKQKLSSETIASLQNAIMFLGQNHDGYQQILTDSVQLLSRIDNSKTPMMYTSIDFGTERGSRELQSLSMIKNILCSFIGLHLNTENLISQSNDERFIMSREQAELWGNKLQSILVDEGNLSSAAVTMDIRTHLAMLQSNTLPRCKGVLGERDVWAISDAMHTTNENGDGMLFEYNYNYNEPFGGCDPLMCPSMGYIVPCAGFSKTFTNKENGAYAAAYSATVGSGLDKLSSLCIATSIRSLFGSIGRPPVYSWKTIDEIVERSIEAGQSTRREDGVPRKMYKDFGYR